MKVFSVARGLDVSAGGKEELLCCAVAILAAKLRSIGSTNRALVPPMRPALNTVRTEAATNEFIISSCFRDSRLNHHKDRNLKLKAEP